MEIEQEKEQPSIRILTTSYSIKAGNPWPASKLNNYIEDLAAQNEVASRVCGGRWEGRNNEHEEKNKWRPVCWF